MNNKKRNINLDLIRCVALILVPSMHGLDNTGLYTIQLQTPADIFMMVLRILFTICIPLYILLTGFLNHRKTTADLRYYLGYVRIYLTYLLCVIPCLFLEYYHKQSLTTIPELIGGVINFHANGYAWYIMMYTGLFIMMPFLNKMHHACAGQKEKLLLIAVFFALSILPSMLNTYVQIYSVWWKNLYPLCYYFTGAYLSEYMPRIKPAKAFALLMGTLLVYSAGFYLVYSGDGTKLGTVYQTSWSVYLLGVLAFIFMYNIRLDGMPAMLRSLIIKISDLTLAIYLLTWIPDGISYPIMVRIAPAVGDRYVWLLLTVPIALVSATLMALLVDALFKPIHKCIMKLLGRLLLKEEKAQPV